MQIWAVLEKKIVIFTLCNLTEYVTIDIFQDAFHIIEYILK